MPAEATPRPWKAVELGSSLWIEGAPGSAASQNLPADRRVICDFTLYGDPDLDAQSRADAELIIRRVNGGETV